MTRHAGGIGLNSHPEQWVIAAKSFASDTLLDWQESGHADGAQLAVWTIKSPHVNDWQVKDVLPGRHPPSTQCPPSTHCFF
jgi:hypothetical protein